MGLYDYLVIGGGSGGLASARRAASYGAKVGLVEAARLGGTCVNVSGVGLLYLTCVPKKVMWNTGKAGPSPAASSSFAASRFLELVRSATVAETLHEAKHYGFAFSSEPKFSWKALKESRDAYVKRLNGIYENNLKNDSVDYIRGVARMKSPTTVEVNGTDFKAKKILIAVGTDVTVYTRTNEILRNFDPIIKHTLKDHMKKMGIKFEEESHVTELARSDKRSPITVRWNSKGNAKMERAYEEVMWAIGRKPAVEGLGLDAVGIETDKMGHIVVDDYQLANRLFGGPRYANARVNYENVPSVVFSHPTSGACGLSEERAREKYGDANVKTYVARFVNMYNAITPEKPPTAYKLVRRLQGIPLLAGEDEKVVGLHIIGRGSDELLQGFAVAINVGTTKAQWDSTVGIHPTAAGEVADTYTFFCGFKAGMLVSDDGGGFLYPLVDCISSRSPLRP
ncbi:MAG: hypothetical protein BJ554DRAFT_5133 [Olpidium bornovanus]|uniref:Glutathione reductase n=1 Tax=Olpidium bornovanus TaxID=278681 RepID=A0A8H7ZM28_9FUNG|nr:MAG: hypothetical protein BJ554DRAFT_5133 [Olpidium bornovanus]